MSKRAVIYARYSSDKQSENSIEDQVRVCKERIDREKLSLGEIYTDRAISAASQFRPSYQQMLRDAAEKKFDVVVTEALDRLSRNLSDIAHLFETLNFLGIEILTVSEGIVGVLDVGLRGTMNQLYLTDLRQKVHRGLKGRIKQGRSAGGNSYGYRVVPGLAEDGTRGQREIIEAEAAIVRRIFEDYASGKSPKKIALGLNQDGIAGPRGKDWGQSTINGNAARGTGILNNEFYIGRLVWNRLRYMKDPATGKRISHLNDETEWLIEEVPEARIIDQNLWQRVKDRQASLSLNRSATGRQSGFWDRRRPRYLLSGLIKCGECGGGYSKISATLFGCSTARNKGTCQNRLNIRRDTLEATILNGLKHHMVKPELYKEFLIEFQKEWNTSIAINESQHKDQRREKASAEDRIKNLVEAIATGQGTKSLTSEIASLETRIEEIDEALGVQPSTPPPLVHPNVPELYRRKLEQLTDLLEDPELKDEVFEVIRSLIDEIVLTPVQGKLRVDLKGDLAGLLRLAQDAKNPASENKDGIAQVKLVAGVGFEPTTFRL